MIGPPLYQVATIHIFILQLQRVGFFQELITSRELGLDLKFFNNRLGIDLTLYNSTAKNQILSAPVSPTSGFSSQVINAGQVDNEGVEIILNGTPIRTDNFSWDVTANYGKNTSKIIALNGDIERLELYKEHYARLAWWT